MIIEHENINLLLLNLPKCFSGKNLFFAVFDDRNLHIHCEEYIFCLFQNIDAIIKSNHKHARSDADAFYWHANIPFRYLPACHSEKDEYWFWTSELFFKRSVSKKKLCPTTAWTISSVKYVPFTIKNVVGQNRERKVLISVRSVFCWKMPISLALCRGHLQLGCIGRNSKEMYSAEKDITS